MYAKEAIVGKTLERIVVAGAEKQISTYISVLPIDYAGLEWRGIGG